MDNSNGNDEPFLIDVEQTIEIVEKIAYTYDADEGISWDLKAFISSMEFLSMNSDSNLKGKVWVVVRTNRNIGRFKADNRFEDAPDTPKGEKGELRIARQIATDIPALILLRQNGDEEKGWRGSPFWWPVLVTPSNMKTVIFSSKSLE